IDCGAVIGGWHSDAAICVVIPDPSRPELVAARQALSEATEEAMWVGVAALTQVKYLNEVGTKIEKYIRDNTKYGIVEEYIGHGIGRSMHEEPPVFNYAVRGNGPEIRAGLVVCIEPIITAGGVRTRVLDDAWTVTTVDGQDACQWEQTVAVHEGGIWVLTEPDGGRAKLAKYGIVPTPIA
ncbi:MAG: M24 family metallopeptidase, partial [Microbacteriaceae bacterium]